MAKTAVYFPGLNGLRFFAALAVLLVHALAQIEQFGYRTGLALDDRLAKLAVLFFFVLSGFLITYLLLVERRERGTIAVGRFYLRRLLRIWPLYYLVVAFSLLILPMIGALNSPLWQLRWAAASPTALVLYLVMLPNFALPLGGIGHFWSIGVEEQFYLVWPLLQRFSARPIAVCLGVIAGYYIALAVLIRIDSGPFLTAWGTLRIDAMAIGGLAAVLLFRGWRGALRVVYSPLTQAAAFIGVTALYTFSLPVPHIQPDLYALLFSLVILNVASNPRSFLKLRHRVFDGLGRVSYGIYVYHPLVAAAVIGFLGPTLAPRLSRLGLAAAVLLLTGLGTVSIAALSYRFFERPFLGLKRRFAVVSSGEEARSELEGEDQDAEGDKDGAGDGAPIQVLLEEDRG